MKWLLMLALLLNGDFEKSDPKDAGKPAGWDKPDGLGVVWSNGVIRMDTRISEMAMVDQWKKVGISQWAIPKPAGNAVAETYGLSYYSDPIPVKSGQTYRVSFDYKGPSGGGKVWVRGWGLFQGEKRRRWETFVNCRTKGDGWTHFEQEFHPTKWRPEVTEMRVMLYAYYPPGVYCFDNVRIEEVSGLPSRKFSAECRTSKEPTVDETKTTLVKELEQFEPDVFWEKNGKKIITITVVVLVVIVGALMWQRQQQAAEEQEGVRLSQASDVASLERFVNTSKSKSLVPMALMKLGDLYFRDGRYAESAGTYQKVVDLYPQSSMVGGAKFSLAAIQEAQGQYEAARGLYSQIAGATTGYAGYLARLGVARCTEALGQTKEAKQLYEELLMAGQMAGGQSLAMIRWAVLGRVQSASPATSNVFNSVEVVNPQILK